jgi:hypothetical protein
MTEIVPSPPSPEEPLFPDWFGSSLPPPPLLAAAIANALTSTPAAIHAQV